MHAKRVRVEISVGGDAESAHLLDTISSIGLLDQQD